MPPIHLDVFALLPEGWGLCQSCEALLAGAGLGEAPSERGLVEAPPDLLADFRRLSTLLLEANVRYGDHLRICIYDPFSLPGMFKALRYGVRVYPTFLINGKEKIVGWQPEKLEEVLRKHIPDRPAARD